MEPIVLGVDPGTVHLGFGVITAAARPRLIEAGALHAPAAWAVARRLAHLQEGLRSVLDRHRPSCIALETSFHGKNSQALLRLGEARGMVIGLAGSLGLPVHDYSPAMVKKAVTGNGNASKDQVARMVRCLVPGIDPDATRDATDALAIAFCHSHRSPGRSMVQAAEAARLRRSP